MQAAAVPSHNWGRLPTRTLHNAFLFCPRAPAPAPVRCLLQRKKMEALVIDLERLRKERQNLVLQIRELHVSTLRTLGMLGPFLADIANIAGWLRCLRVGGVGGLQLSLPVVAALHLVVPAPACPLCPPGEPPSLPLCPRRPSRARTQSCG